MKTYSVKGNRTAADVVAGREEIIETGYDLESAKIAAIQLQKTGEFAAAWIEEEEAKASPRRQGIDTARFATVVATAKAAAADSPRWLRAIDRAAAAIVAGELIVTTLVDGALVTSPNGTYHANGSCQCKAAQNGHRECYHRAAARLVELCEEARAQTSVPARPQVTPRITRSIERDHSGTPVKVERCDGWAI